MAARLETNAQAIDFLRMNNIVEFVARTSGDKDNTVIFKTDKEKTQSENLDNFRAVVEMTIGSYYIIESGARGAHRIEVRNDKQPAINPALQGIPTMVQGIAPDEVQQRINEAIERYEAKRELEILRAQNKELIAELKESDTAISRIAKRAEPFIGQMLSSVVGRIIPQQTAVGIAGTDPIFQDPELRAVDDSNLNSEEIRVISALQRWSNADEDYISILEAIANMAESKDPTYGMAKGFLIK